MDVKSTLENGKATITLNTGRELTFDLDGNWTVYSDTASTLTVMEGYNILSITTMDVKGLPADELAEVMAEFEEYEKLGTYNGWDIYSVEGVAMLVREEDGAYMLAFTLGDLDTSKAAVDKISNIAVK